MDLWIVLCFAAGEELVVFFFVSLSTAASVLALPADNGGFVDDDLDADIFCAK